jgi:2',3'-cyclic-nucleotide 2'-phosphodiesterase (5'-nucleotidase family)
LPWYLRNALVFVQINDVYNIAVKTDYRRKNALILPRIATVVKRLRRLLGEERVIFALPGDFLSPSALSRRFHGEQMVRVLEAMGVDLVCFGNHELDKSFITPARLVEIIEGSRLKWVSTNLRLKPESVHTRLEAMGKMRPAVAYPLSDSTAVLLYGLLYSDEFPPFGMSLPPEKGIEVLRRNPGIIGMVLDEAYSGRWEAGSGDRDVYTIEAALTHQTIQEDIELAHNVPELRLIMGGHDHNVETHEPNPTCLITKTRADAKNVRFNWILELDDARLFKKNDESESESDAGQRILEEIVWSLIWVALRMVPWNPYDWRGCIKKFLAAGGFVGRSDFKFGGHLGPGVMPGKHLLFESYGFRTDIPEFLGLASEHWRTRRTIDKWIRRSGISCRAIWTSSLELHLDDALLRKGSTNFGNFVADVVRGAPHLAAYLPSRPLGSQDVGLFNSGAMRINRNLARGEEISEMILAEVFFWDAEIVVASMTGKELLAILERCLELIVKYASEGFGNFLQVSGVAIQHRGGVIERVLISNEEGPTLLDPEASYTVATSAYLAGCKEYDGLFPKELRPLGINLKADIVRVLEALEGNRVRAARGAPHESEYESEVAMIFPKEPRWIEEGHDEGDAPTPAGD